MKPTLCALRHGDCVCGVPLVGMLMLEIVERTGSGLKHLWFGRFSQCVRWGFANSGRVILLAEPDRIPSDSKRRIPLKTS